MQRVTEHAEGMFSWTDLATSDVDAAKRFYADLFGWSYDDQPAGPNATYSMAKLEGASVAAIYTEQADEVEQGIPPHWTCYTTVRDADAVAARARGIGGRVLVAPFDIFDVGRMCVLADPTGGVMAYWQPKRHIGAELIGRHGTITWSELLTRDVEAAKKFYVELLGYEAETSPMPDGDYTALKVGGKPAVGIVAMPPQIPADVPAYWAPYFRVDGCDATVDKARAGGATILVPTKPIPGVGRFATIQDAQGAVLNVLEPETAG